MHQDGRMYFFPAIQVLPYTPVMNVGLYKSNLHCISGRTMKIRQRTNTFDTNEINLFQHLLNMRIRSSRVKHALFGVWRHMYCCGRTDHELNSVHVPITTII